LKSYTFEYTRQGFTYLLFGVSVAILGLGLWLFRTLFGNTLPAGLVVVLIIGSSVAFFLLNKHRIRKTGTATISVDELTIALNQTVHVPFNGLKYYYIYFGKNGTVFTLGFLDGKKINYRK